MESTRKALGISEDKDQNSSAGAAGAALAPPPDDAHLRQQQYRATADWVATLQNTLPTPTGEELGGPSRTGPVSFDSRAEPDDPNYTAYGNSLILQHPQPRQPAQPQRAVALEQEAMKNEPSEAHAPEPPQQSFTIVMDHLFPRTKDDQELIDMAKTRGLKPAAQYMFEWNSVVQPDALHITPTHNKGLRIEGMSSVSVPTTNLKPDLLQRTGARLQPSQPELSQSCFLELNHNAWKTAEEGAQRGDDQILYDDFIRPELEGRRLLPSDHYMLTRKTYRDSDGWNKDDVTITASGQNRKPVPRRNEMDPLTVTVPYNSVPEHIQESLKRQIAREEKRAESLEPAKVEGLAGQDMSGIDGGFSAFEQMPREKASGATPPPESEQQGRTNSASGPSTATIPFTVVLYEGLIDALLDPERSDFPQDVLDDRFLLDLIDARNIARATEYQFEAAMIQAPEGQAPELALHVTAGGDIEPPEPQDVELPPPVQELDLPVREIPAELWERTVGRLAPAPPTQSYLIQVDPTAWDNNNAAESRDSELADNEKMFQVRTWEATAPRTASQQLQSTRAPEELSPSTLHETDRPPSTQNANDTFALGATVLGGWDAGFPEVISTPSSIQNTPINRTKSFTRPDSSARKVDTGATRAGLPHYARWDDWSSATNSPDLHDTQRGGEDEMQAPQALQEGWLFYSEQAKNPGCLMPGANYYPDSALENGNLPPPDKRYVIPERIFISAPKAEEVLNEYATLTDRPLQRNPAGQILLPVTHPPQRDAAGNLRLPVKRSPESKDDIVLNYDNSTLRDARAARVLDDFARDELVRTQNLLPSASYRHIWYPETNQLQVLAVDEHGDKLTAPDGKQTNTIVISLAEAGVPDDVQQSARRMPPGTFEDALHLIYRSSSPAAPTVYPEDYEMGAVELVEQSYKVIEELARERRDLYKLYGTPEYELPSRDIISSDAPSPSAVPYLQQLKSQYSRPGRELSDASPKEARTGETVPGSVPALPEGSPGSRSVAVVSDEVDVPSPAIMERGHRRRRDALDPQNFESPLHSESISVAHSDDGGTRGRRRHIAPEQPAFGHSESPVQSVISDDDLIEDARAKIFAEARETLSHDPAFLAAMIVSMRDNRAVRAAVIDLLREDPEVLAQLVPEINVGYEADHDSDPPSPTRERVPRQTRRGPAQGKASGSQFLGSPAAAFDSEGVEFQSANEEPNAGSASEGRTAPVAAQDTHNAGESLIVRPRSASTLHAALREASPPRNAPRSRSLGGPRTHE